MKHLYRTAAQILRANGYAPGAIPEGAAMPPGPWALGNIDYSAHEGPEDTSSAAIFTTLHPRPGTFAGAIADPISTWVAVISMKPNPHANVIVRSIVRAIGKSPSFMDEDGTTIWPLKVSGHFNPFEFVDLTGKVRIEGGIPSFIPVSGNWRNGDFLTVPRAELPVIDRTRAEALIAEVDALLIASTPMPVVVPPAIASPTPLETLQENGYEARVLEGGVSIVTAPPVPLWAPEGYDRWIVTVTLKSPLPELHELIASRLGKCPVRVSPDGTFVYLLRLEDRYAWATVEFSGNVQDGFVSRVGTYSMLRVEAHNRALVVSGLDGYRWINGSPLTVHRKDLPVMNTDRARHLVNEMQGLLQRLSLARAG